MSEYKFIKGEATLPSGSPAPVKIRKKIQGFKGVQATEDFKLQIDDKFFYGRRQIGLSLTRYVCALR